MFKLSEGSIAHTTTQTKVYNEYHKRIMPNICSKSTSDQCFWNWKISFPNLLCCGFILYHSNFPTSESVDVIHKMPWKDTMLVKRFAKGTGWILQAEHCPASGVVAVPYMEFLTCGPDISTTSHGTLPFSGLSSNWERPVNQWMWYTRCCGRISCYVS